MKSSLKRLVLKENGAAEATESLLPLPSTGAVCLQGTVGTRGTQISQIRGWSCWFEIQDSKKSMSLILGERI